MSLIVIMDRHAYITHIILILISIQSIIGNARYQDDLIRIAEDIDKDANADYLNSLNRPYEIVYPQQYRKSEDNKSENKKSEKRLLSLSTQEHNVRSRITHFSHTSFNIYFKGLEYKLRLNQNKGLFKRGLKLKRNLDVENTVIEEWAVDACVYQGYVREIGDSSSHRIDDSRLTITTCNGLRGVIYMESETYFLEPLMQTRQGNETLWPHVMYKPGGTEHTGTCGNGGSAWRPYQELHMGEFLRTIKFLKTHIEGPEPGEKQHLNLGLVMDHALYKALGESIDESLEYALGLANLVDMTYNQYNFTLHLTFLEIWNLEDKFPASNSIKRTLQDFLLYRQSTMTNIHPDVTAFITASTFEGEVSSLAIPDSICTDRAVLVMQIPNPTHIHTKPPTQPTQPTTQPTQPKQPTTQPTQPHENQDISFETESVTQEIDTDQLELPEIGDDEDVESSVRRRSVTKVEDIVRHHVRMEGLKLGAATLAHMMGHILGVRHDQERSCECLNPDGCLLENDSILATDGAELSSCGEQDLRGAIMAGLSVCLHDPGHQQRFSQACGNGKLERGEECDCGSAEDCALQDPCCDPDTCLMRAWATCRHGDCCYNCTVLPAAQLCRAPHSPCDVPEYCTGHSGECPADRRVQDGQACMNRGVGVSGEGNPEEDREKRSGYCYQGECNTRQNQCQAIWGTDAEASDDQCYKQFNPHGIFSGHCGYDTSTRSYTKCADRDVVCGLLHCESGNEKPVNEGPIVVSTSVAVRQHQYQCKILNETLQPVGMVLDGTRCGEGRLCIQARCVPLSDVMTTTCPRAANGLICAGNGLCTDEVKCFCYHTHEGADCSVKVKVTSTTKRPLNTFKPIAEHQLNLTVPGGILADYTTPILAPDTTPITLIKGGSWTLVGLIVVLGAVALGTMLLFTCCMLCYRRRSPKKKVSKAKSKKPKLFGSVLYEASVKSESGSELNLGSRVISFGKLPSYKKEKLKKLRQSTQSETGSEHSQAERDSTGSDLKPLPPVPVAAPPPERGILKHQCSVGGGAGGSGSKNSSPKKRGRSLENLKRASNYRHTDATTDKLRSTDELEPLCTLRNTFEPPRDPYRMHRFFGSKGKALSASNGALPDSVEYRIQLQRQMKRQTPNYSFFPGESPMFQRPKQYAPEENQSDHPYFAPPTNLYPQSEWGLPTDPQGNAVRPESGDYMHLLSQSIQEPKVYQRIENATDFENESECTCSSEDEQQNAAPSDLDLSDLEGNANDSRDAETQTDSVLTPDSACSSLPRDESVDSLQGTKNRIKKLKNINDLLKQIDEQFNTVLQQTQNDLTSPASSEETHCSEPEADRQFSDASQTFGDLPVTEGESKSNPRDSMYTNRSSYLTTDNEDMGNSNRASSVLLSSPSPLPSPGCLVSPVCGSNANEASNAYPFTQKTSTPKEHPALKQRFQLTPQRKPFAVSSTSAFNRLPVKSIDTPKTDNKSSRTLQQNGHSVDSEDSSSSPLSVRSHGTPVCHSSPKKAPPSSQGSPVPSPRYSKPQSKSHSPELHSSSSIDRKSGSPVKSGQKRELSPCKKSGIPRLNNHKTSYTRGDTNKSLDNTSRLGGTNYFSPNVSSSRVAETHTAIPYRGAKSSSSSSLVQSSEASQPSSDTSNPSSPQRSLKGSKAYKKPIPPPRGTSVKLSSPSRLIPVRRTLSMDQRSEGYHSDRTDNVADYVANSNNLNNGTDNSVIVRELPEKPRDLKLKHLYKKPSTLGGASSPEDVCV